MEEPRAPSTTDPPPALGTSAPGVAVPLQTPAPGSNVAQWQTALQDYCKNVGTVGNMPLLNLQNFQATGSGVPPMPFYGLFGQPPGLTLALPGLNGQGDLNLPSTADAGFKRETEASSAEADSGPNSKRSKQATTAFLAAVDSINAKSSAAAKLPPSGLPPLPSSGSLPAAAALTLPSALHSMSTYWAAAAALTAAQQSQSAAAAAQQAHSNSDGSPGGDVDTKKLRRKQSNRESARRSRMRKQSETDKLAESCSALMRENEDLKQQLGSHKIAVDRLAADKAALLQLVKDLGGQLPAHLDASSTWSLAPPRVTGVGTSE